MFDEVEVTLNGTPLSYITETWGELELNWRYPVGSWEASFSMDSPINFRHPDLVRGARFEAWVGPTPIWRGSLTEPNFDDMTFVATGVGREAETALSLGFGVLTTNPATAVSWGILRGALSWNGLNSLPSVSIAGSEETVTYNYISELLAAWSEQEEVNYWVDPYGFIYYGAAPSSPSMFVTPGAGVLGQADEDYVTDLYGRYYSKPGKVASVEAHDGAQNVGRIERGVSLTTRGVMSATQAQAVMNGILAKGRARTGWTNGVEVAFGQVCTDGGTPVALSEVGRACGSGAMVRLLGLFDERGVSTHTDVVIAEATWRVADGTMTLSPVGLAERSLSSIVEAVGGALL